MTGSIDLTDRASFGFWHTEQIRFSDTDMLGHVNNVAYAAIVESGRVAFVRRGALGPVPSDLLTVMVRVEIDYRREVHYPAEIAVGSRLLSFGRSSMVLGNGVFTEKFCAATAVTTLVLIDSATRRPSPITAEMRAVMEAQLP